MSRSIGDAHLKNWVPAEPDTKILHFTSDMEFLVLASDGFWDEVRKERFFYDPADLSLLCVVACPKMV